MDIPHFVCSSVGHLVCFQSLAVMNNAAMSSVFCHFFPSNICKVLLLKFKTKD